MNSVNVLTGIHYKNDSNGLTGLRFSIGFKAFSGSIDRLTSLLSRKKSTDVLHVSTVGSGDTSRLLLAISDDGGETHAIEWLEHYPELKTEGTIGIPVRPLLAAMDVFRVSGAIDLSVTMSETHPEWTETRGYGSPVHHPSHYSITLSSQNATSITFYGVNHDRYDHELGYAEEKETIIYSGSRAEFADLFKLASLTTYKPTGSHDRDRTITRVKVDKTPSYLKIQSTDGHRSTQITRSDLPLDQMFINELIPGSLFQSYFKICDKVKSSEPIQLSIAENGDYIIRIDRLFCLRVAPRDLGLARYPDLGTPLRVETWDCYRNSAIMNREALIKDAEECMKLAKKYDAIGVMAIKFSLVNDILKTRISMRYPAIDNNVDGTVGTTIREYEIPNDGKVITGLRDGESCRIGLAADYLRDYLINVSGHLVKIALNGESNPMYWGEYDPDSVTNLVYTLMPVQLRR